MATADSFDVIVLGAGAGGMTAACVAASEGLDTVVLEKTRCIGGTTAISGGMVWAPNSAGDCDSTDSPAQAETYLDETVPTDAGRDLRRAFLKAAPKAIAYMRRHTSVQLKPVPFYPDYYPAAAGSTTSGRVLEPVPFDGRELGPAFNLLRPPLPEFTLFGGMMVARPDLPHFRNVFHSLRSARRVLRLMSAYFLQRIGHRRGVDLVLGNALAGRFLKSLLDLSVPVRLGVEVLRIERDSERITGVVIIEDGVERFIGVRRGVILATGGFSHDRARRAALYPHQAQDVSMVPETATGDGLRFGEGVGGRVEEGQFGSGFWTPASRYVRADGRRVVFPHSVTDRGKPGLIAVNAEGRRFTNEAVSYHAFVKAMLRADNSGQTIPARLICDSRFIWKYGLGAIKPMTLRLQPFKAAGYLSEARTIGDLAKRIGVDAQVLEATVARHNQDARNGVDTAFGRGGDVYQRHYGDPEICPNPCMAPIEKPPFYSVSVYPADLGTAAGLATNEHAQVLDDDGSPTPGLYACGADMRSIMQGAYPGPGVTIGPALVFGYLAAQHIAREGRTGTD
jgi:succinate dehydrogenase/fumarate reductase flavoprotein subunit